MSKHIQLVMSIIMAILFIGSGICTLVSLWTQDAAWLRTALITFAATIVLGIGRWKDVF